MRNLVLGLCSNCDLDQVKPFLLSWRNNVKSARLTLLAAQPGEELRAFAQAEGIELIDPAPLFDIGFHPDNARFFFYRFLLRSRAGQYDSILLTDVQDVIFQSDPFDVPRRKPVTFAREHQVIAHEQRWNRRWLCEIYGESLVLEIENNPVCCVGTTIGTQEGILRYLDLMCNELSSRPIDRKINYDQGFHNYIAWKLQPDFVEIDNQDEIMCTMGGINPHALAFAGNQVVINGTASPVLHQWDRSPALRTYVAGQIETPATAFVSTAPQKPAASFVPSLDLAFDPYGRSLPPQQESDRFFRAMLHPDRTLRSVITFYINFHGSINWGQQNVLVEQVKSLIGPEAAAFTRTDILGNSGEFTPTFLARFAPDLASAYFMPEASPAACEMLQPATRNDWLDENFPSSLNGRLRRADRPAFSLLNISGFELFASAYGYQLFDPGRGTYLPAVSSRAFSRAVQFYPRREISAPLVIVQDEYDGGNFAHFLFDWLPRILHFAEWNPELARKAVYLMGGAQGELHDLIISLLCEKRGMDRRQFLFPPAREVIVPKDRIYLFSDQRQPIIHPLHMGHPETIRLVRELLEDYIAAESEGPARIYISRRDAAMRRVANEDELLARLRERGYADICLSDLSLREQIRVVGSARSIVAPHGMGLTHILFNRGGGELLELFNPVVGTDAYAFAARALGMRYGYVLGQETGDRAADFTVDVNEVMAWLDGNSTGTTQPVDELAPLSLEERMHIFEMLARRPRVGNLCRRLLVAGKDAAVAQPGAEAALAPLGFAFVNPDQNTEEALIPLFAGAEALVLLGRAGMRALRYCAPDTPVILVTPPGEDKPGAYLQSLNLNYHALTGQSLPGGWTVGAEQCTKALSLLTAWLGADSYP
jgi:capsular polysaccharide biosynthesis protein